MTSATEPKLRDAIIDLYLDVKVRSNDEVRTGKLTVVSCRTWTMTSWLPNASTSLLWSACPSLSTYERQSKFC